MSSSNQKSVSEQKAFEIGVRGGNVKTYGMQDQAAKKIDAAVNAGRQAAANSGKQGK